MVRTIMKYIVESADGRWRAKRVTPGKERRHKDLRPKDGKIKLGDFVYTLNPARMRRERYRKGFRHEEAYIQLWEENNPEPMDLFAGYLDRSKETKDRTGEIITILSRSERLKRLVQPSKDWTLFIMGTFIGLFLGYVISEIAAKYLR